MSSAFSVQPEAVQQAGNSFDTHANNLEDVINQVSANVRTLADSWTGPAQAQFQMLADQWGRDVNQMHQTLLQIAQNLKTAGESYGQLDDSIRRTFTAR